ncbi:hypothetical protein JOD02_002076 [Caldicoprobacter guelmensis]|uniref:hypothetical protein n=1 Tax=Caldicoprobacter guelmensis TaxID=1170224 RepID=UPI0019562472|nr:hypothetical protein [Caldicoprobacter guelmensis]MBM7583198.1 hypothetical protein [Caldicoprobacter guelmensis]
MEDNNCKFYVQLKDLQKYIDQTVNVKAVIRTVIDRGDTIKISLCDGSLDIGIDDDLAVWVEPVAKELLIKKGLSLPLIAAEKIALKKVKVLEGTQYFSTYLGLRYRTIPKSKLSIKR